MSLPSNPQQLAALAQGFRRLDKKTLLSIQAKLLAKIAGYGDNPDIDALNRASVQFRNLPATAQVAARTLVIQGNAISGWTLDQGNDPVLGPPYPPVNYQLYIARGTCPPQTTCLAPAQTTSAGTFPAATQPGPNVTRLSWTVPDILANISASEVNYAVTISFTNYLNFPAKTTAVAMLSVPGSIDYPTYRAVNGLTNNASTDSGTTTAAMVNNGDNTSTVTLAGGSYVFTPTLQYPTGPGAILHWDDGQEVIVVSITDTTHAIVDGGATKSAQQFTMYNTAATPNLSFAFPSLANTYANPGVGSVFVRFTSTVNGVQRVLNSNVFGISAPSIIAGGPNTGIIQLSQEDDGLDQANIISGGNDSPDPTNIDSLGFIFSLSSTIPENDGDATVTTISSLPGVVGGISHNVPVAFYWRVAWWNSVTGRKSNYSSVQTWTP